MQQIGKTGPNGVCCGQIWHCTNYVSSHCITHSLGISPAGVDLVGTGFIPTGACALCSHSGALPEMKCHGAYGLCRKPCLECLVGTQLTIQLTQA